MKFGISFDTLHDIKADKMTMKELELVNIEEYSTIQ